MPCTPKLRGKLVLSQCRQHEEAADVEDVGRCDGCRGDVGSAERGVRSERVDVPAVFSGHRDDHGLRGAEVGCAADAGHVDACGAQLVLDEVAEEIVSHLRHDGGPHAEPRQRDSGVGSATAGLDDEILRRDELSRLRQARQRRHEYVGDDDAGADDGGAGAASHPRRRYNNDLGAPEVG